MTFFGENLKSDICRSAAASRAPTYNIDIVDQLGRGGSLAASFLYAYLSSGDVQIGLDYSVAYAELKHSLPGDFNWCTRQEVDALIAGNKPGLSH
jgi:2-dehydro-3-deoxygluconokinase